MSSKRLSRIRKTIGFQLTAWYSAFFILSVVVLFGLAYLLLASSLRYNDREGIHLKLTELVAQYAAGGLDGVKRVLAVQGRLHSAKPFFIRVAGAQQNTLFLQVPDQWADFDLRRLEGPATVRNGQWTSVPAKGDESLLEVETARLPDGSFLQVGKSTEDRDSLLERFRAIVAGAMVVVVGLAFGGGAFLSFRALRPIRNLIRTVRAIEAGTLEARVATRQTGDELDELGLLFNRMLDRIGTLIRGMRGALDNVAHDLRTPMARLRGTAELALRSGEDLPTYREALGDCVEESDRLITMLNTLMDISEAETGTLTLDLQPVNLATLIGDAVELYGYLAEEKKITISTTAPRDLSVTADRTRMQQVLANLLDNAVKYTAPGGRIALTASAQRDEVVIVVEDTGIGVLPEDLPKIWDRLYRGDQSRSQRGLGLGLSLVKAVVQAHRGSVQVASEVGAGTRFTLCFPATAAPAH
jgi:signal transduction histidine kinase